MKPASRRIVSPLRTGRYTTQMWEWQLEELALYFLLYTEAANLRHLPEALWFLFWVLRNSPHRMAQVRAHTTIETSRRVLHCCLWAGWLHALRHVRRGDPVDRTVLY